MVASRSCSAASAATSPSRRSWRATSATARATVVTGAPNQRPIIASGSAAPKTWAFADRPSRPAAWRVQLGPVGHRQRGQAAQDRRAAGADDGVRASQDGCCRGECVAAAGREEGIGVGRREGGDRSRRRHEPPAATHRRPLRRPRDAQLGELGDRQHEALRSRGLHDAVTRGHTSPPGLPLRRGYRAARAPGRRATRRPGRCRKYQFGSNRSVMDAIVGRRERLARACPQGRCRLPARPGRIRCCGSTRTGGKADGSADRRGARAWGRRRTRSSPASV